MSEDIQVRRVAARHERSNVARIFRATTLPPSIAPLQATLVSLALISLGVAALATAGLPPAAWLGASAFPLGSSAWPVTAVFATLFALLQKHGFVFHWRTQSTKVSLDEIALFVGALALPPAHIVLGIGASSLVNQLLHRRDPVKATFNISQYVISAMLAVLAVVALRKLGAPAPWPAIVAPLVFAVMTALLVSALFSRMGEGRTLRIFRERFGSLAFVNSALGLSLGLIVYALFALSPFAVLAAVPVFFYLRRFGRLSEWADDELKTHKLLAHASVDLAGRSDLDVVARQVLTACHELFDCGEAQLSFGENGRGARFWRESFGESGASSGGITAPVQDASGKRIGELTVFPKPGQRAFGEREHHLLRTVGANAAAAAANTRALQSAMDANRLLVESEQRYRSLFETANVLIHVVDEAGRIVDMNPAAFATLGYTRESIIRRPIQEILGDAELFERLRRTRELRGVETAIRTADGHELCLLLDAQELDGGVDGARYVLASRDITSLKTLERELRASMESQRETIRRLENMNRELEEFTLWTTHDMREPLRSIGTIAQFLHEDIHEIPPDEAQDMARRIHDGSERLKERVKALHAFSRIVQRDGEFEDVSLQAVVADVIDGLEAKIHESGADVRLLEGSLPTVRAQPQRIHQVFANLVENALKYGRAEKPVVEIGAVEAPGEWRIFVRDNGRGIPPGLQDRIFQLFQRGPDECEPGSGAGLAIVKRIAEQHGGRTWVEPAPGGGACFYVALPRRTEDLAVNVRAAPQP